MCIDNCVVEVVRQRLLSWLAEAAYAECCDQVAKGGLRGDSAATAVSEMRGNVCSFAQSTTRDPCLVSIYLPIYPHSFLLSTHQLAPGLPTYLPTYLPTCLPTYLHAIHFLTHTHTHAQMTGVLCTSPASRIGSSRGGESWLS